MKILFGLLLLTFCFYQTATAQKTHKFIDSSIKVDRDNVPVDKKQYYFPKLLFPRIENEVEEKSESKYRMIRKVYSGEFDHSSLKYYSENLFDMNVPLLFNRAMSKSVYRFLWLRSYMNPILITIEKNHKRYLLTSKEIQKTTGSNSKNAVVIQRKKISKVEWKEFLLKIEKSDFWNMERSGKLGLDGSNWVLEGAEPSKYHVVDDWSPGKGAFYDACMYLINLSELKIDKDDIF
jgi:hypothetical protein